VSGNIKYSISSDTKYMLPGIPFPLRRLQCIAKSTSHLMLKAMLPGPLHKILMPNQYVCTGKLAKQSYLEKLLKGFGIGLRQCTQIFVGSCTIHSHPAQFNVFEVRQVFLSRLGVDGLL